MLDGFRLLADKGYDRNTICKAAAVHDVWANIPPRSNLEVTPYTLPGWRRQRRDLAKCSCNRIEHFRGGTTCFEKYPGNNPAAPKLIPARIWWAAQ